MFVTNNQVFGFVILAVANVMSLVLLQNVANVFSVGYLILSLFEHVILESSNRKFLTQWTSLRDILTVILGNQDDPDNELEDIESRSTRAEEGTNNTAQRFDFSKNSTKMVYAGMKLGVAVLIAIFYVAVFKVAFTSPFQKTKSKSIFMLTLLVILSAFRDKHEKKIATTYEPSKLHFGRALFTPLIYLSFTVLALMDHSVTTMLTASAYQLGYLYFYYDQCKELLLGEKTPSEDQIPLLTPEGKLNISAAALLGNLGLQIPQANQSVRKRGSKRAKAR